VLLVCNYYVNTCSLYLGNNYVCMSILVANVMNLETLICFCCYFCIYIVNCCIYLYKYIELQPFLKTLYNILLAYHVVR
jgi:hypothetical protein